eukprot:354455-Chlamydomonas_euryale.AAC.1
MSMCAGYLWTQFIAIKTRQTAAHMARSPRYLTASIIHTETRSSGYAVTLTRRANAAPGADVDRMSMACARQHHARAHSFCELIEASMCMHVRALSE